MTEDISKNILGLYYALRVAMTLGVALCVLALHVYCNTFNNKRLDEMIEDEVKEIKMKEEIRANIENVAVAVMKTGTETQVRFINSVDSGTAQADTLELNHLTLTLHLFISSMITATNHTLHNTHSC